MLVVLAASSLAVLGCADDGGIGDSAGSGPVSGTSVQPRTFADTVNSLCDQRHTALGGMRSDVFRASGQFGVGELTNAFARSSLGVMRDQIPLLRAAPQAPAGWDSLVSDYERLAQASNVAAGDAAAVTFAWFDPFGEIDLRAYEMGATSCPARLHDGTTRTPTQEGYALVANSACMAPLVAYSTSVLAVGHFRLGPKRFEPVLLSDEAVDEVSRTVADGWVVAEPVVRAVPAPVADEATVVGLIDAIDTLMAVFPSGDLTARRRALEGTPFDALDTTALQRFGLLACTGTDAM